MENRVWNIRDLDHRQMRSLSASLCKIWPSLAQPYNEIDLEDPSELFLYILELLDRPKATKTGNDGALIRAINFSGGLSRCGGSVVFSPHSAKTQIRISQNRTGGYNCQVDFGRRSVWAASYLLAELAESPNFVDLLDFGQEDEERIFQFSLTKKDHLSGLKMTEETKEKFVTVFDDEFFEEVELVDKL